MSSLKELLIKHEGLRLKPYKDTVGKLTIGVGRNLDDIGISAAEAEAMLLNDVARCREDASKSFLWFSEIDPVRQDVVLSMIFNMGLSGFMEFRKTIVSIASKEFDVAADEMLASKWATQVGRRAHELSEMMRTGNYLNTKE